MSDDAVAETIELSMPVLGTRPYTLIEMRESTVHPGEPALFVQSGGGAEDQPLYMPLLALAEASPEGNPVAEMLRTVWKEKWTKGHRNAVEDVTRQFNEAWLPFVRGGAG